MTLLVSSSTGESDFHTPSIAEFFPPGFLFAGTPFEINRVMLVRFVSVIALMLFFWLGTRRMRIVPRRFQSIVEMAFDFVRITIAKDILGDKDARRFLPVLVTIFFAIIAMNLTGVIPFLNIAGTSVVGMPLFLGLVAYITFIYAGIKDRGFGFFKNALFPPGAPFLIYFILTPIELLQTFIIRPLSLALRLVMNMIVGHLLLVLCFSATQFFFVSSQVNPGFALFGAVTFVGGGAFTLFELLVALLQAYIFTLLAAVYIQLAVAEEH
ncbi:F0F1 ATP synthase subunit A [Rathayibacter toxicus]|uniref:ATP synthase subunit a n=1 Tax=Rathayibacter toxicus TaxID=145458 RepID=A0A0C5BHY1_9MICO|nr:F0F1 ATP synthase subunit A [Rathayibacter toxicus]AJM77895.1 ATP synthase F0F1 subunit A [Rathayibacter toxicus]ALS57912.1 ATP synthase F0F1 subunit A [Rathayibacter toxicus]KKM46895.1 ATP synthase F0F1 subunit A [Rathayibacter toxicus]PPG20409.1 ATP synthase F0 subunit A [Rathayibacter toxicus]PPG45511.1 ATP synthase F0 subunit A [Rathayibacter toxicus]